MELQPPRMFNSHFAPEKVTVSPNAGKPGAIGSNRNHHHFWGKLFFTSGVYDFFEVLMVTMLPKKLSYDVKDSTFYNGWKMVRQWQA